MGQAIQEGPMNQDTADLLASWIADNVRPVPEDEIEAEAAHLAAEFTAYAKDAGLNARDLAELEAELGEDLASHMEDALEAALSRADGREAGGGD
jgi:hypothetical protein